MRQQDLEKFEFGIMGVRKYVQVTERINNFCKFSVIPKTKADYEKIRNEKKMLKQNYKNEQAREL